MVSLIPGHKSMIIVGMVVETAPKSPVLLLSFRNR
jgi:hypothetical protein